MRTSGSARHDAMRRIAIGGVLGAVPGLLFALVPLWLHGFGVISADESQIGFAGVPLLIIGTLIGILSGAAGAGSMAAVVLGIVAGFIAGVAAGVQINAGLQAVGLGLPGISLFLAPLGMIGGAVLAAYLWGRHVDGKPVV